MKIVATLILLLGTIHSLKANEDSLRHEIHANFSGTINQTSEGSVYQLTHTLNYGYKQERMTFNARAGMIFGQSLGNLTNRDFNVGSDINVFWDDAKKWYAWGLGNGINSYSLKINHQFQVGGGLAWNAIDEKHISLNISDGLVYEQSEIISGEGELINYSTLRNSMRINFRYTWKEAITFRTTNYWQPSLTVANDNIITSNTELQIKLWKWVHINSKLQYNMISRTEKENIIFSYGLSLQHRF